MTTDEFNYIHYDEQCCKLYGLGVSEEVLVNLIANSLDITVEKVKEIEKDGYAYLGYYVNNCSSADKIVQNLFVLYSKLSNKHEYKNKGISNK